MAESATPPPAALEETGYIPSWGGWLYSLLCRPRAGVQAAEDANAGRAGVVLLSPLAEERKSSLRPFVEIARSLAGNGLTALRFDFRGTGDSSGTSEELSVDSMVEDAVAAARWLRESEACGAVALSGLRLGAAVALLAAGRAEASALALVQPVVKGERYVREIERKQAIRRMLTKGKGAPAKEGGDGPFDLDGLALDRSFLDSLKRIDLAESARALQPEKASKKAPRALVLEVGARRSPSAEATRLAEALGESAELDVTVAEPFWLQTDYVDPAPAAKRLADFLGRALGSAPGPGPGGPARARRDGGNRRDKGEDT